MDHKIISLYDGRPWVTLEYFGNELPGGPRDAMLVIPGGGYSVVCADREGYPIALAYLLQNRNAFILNYSTGSQIRYPNQPLEEAAKAIAYIREHAQEYDILPERVFAVGFSAGGHLAGWIATCWKKNVLSNVNRDSQLSKPKGVILCYPVVSIYSERERWFENLFKTSPITDEQLAMVALNNQVDADSAPAFIMHTYDDETVPVRNALDLAQSYYTAEVPFELHIYPHAPHGISLGNKVTSVGKKDFENSQISRWVIDSTIWMDSIQ